MAIIGRIIDKSWLIVALIGLALVAFILSDYQSWFGGSGEQYGYGTIGGEMVDGKLYETATVNYRQMDEQQFQQQQRPYTQKDQMASDTKAWNAIADSVILQKQFDALGITVSDTEFDAYLYGERGFEVIPDIAQNFTDPATGMFSLKLLQSRVDEMKKSTKPEEKTTWEQTKRSLTMRRMQEKYFQLLEQGSYVTKLEAKDYYIGQNRKKSISYVAQRFTEIPDEEIKISDADLKKYYEEHKDDAKYRIKSNSREIKYFAIDIVPSKQDSTTFMTKMNEDKALFASKKTAKQDSLFVTMASEWPYYIPKAGFRGDKDANQTQQQFTYPSAMDSVFKNASIGTIVGPYLDKGKYRLAKVIGYENQTYSVRHILISAQKQDTLGSIAKKKTVDSLMTVVNKDNFDAMVLQYSEDPGSKQSGGKIENFLAGEMVPEFSNFAKENAVGKIGYVQSDFGFHIIEVLEKKAAHIPNLAIIEKTLEPSPETLDDIKGNATNLVLEIHDKVSAKSTLRAKYAKFDTLAIRNNYMPLSLTLDEKNLQVYGMNTIYAEDKMIQLAFDNKYNSGDVNLSPIKDETRYLISMLGVVKNEGEPTFEALEAQLRVDLMTEKKANILIERMRGKKLEDLAKKFNVEVQKGDVLFGSGSLPMSGFEPEVVGSLFSKAIKDGQRTLPLKGKNGVYVIQINSTTKEVSTKVFDKEIETLKGQNTSSFQNDAIMALRENADVIDNRRFLKIGIRR